MFNKQKILKFWCDNLYPFCCVEKVKADFKMGDNGEYEKIDISIEEHLKNKNIRERNIEALNKKGGLKKYLINWIALAILYSLIAFTIIEPQTIWQKIPFVITNFIFYAPPFFLFIFHLMLDKKIGED